MLFLIYIDLVFISGFAFQEYLKILYTAVISIPLEILHLFVPTICGFMVALPNFILKLKGILKENGKIIIADISFKNHKDMLYCKNVSESNWDNDEIYLVADKMVKRLTEFGLMVRYTQISSCAGVLEIE